MTLAEFIHVSQFYETIICFSILLLIGQRIVMLCKDLDEKYLKARAKEFDDQIDWQKSFSDEKELIAKEQEEQRQRQEERKRQQEERQRQQEQRKAKQAPQQQNLRSSLVQNQHEQTDRGLKENQEKPERRPSTERKSLVDLRKSQQKSEADKSQYRSSVERNSLQRNSNEKKPQQNQPKQIQDQIPRDNEVELRKSKDNSEKINQTPMRSSLDSRKSQKSQKTQQRNKTIKLEQQDLKNIDINRQQPSINPQEQENQEDRLEREYKDKQKIRYFTRIDGIFNQYLPILLSVLILGMLSHSTYIFTMVCFFGYMFSSLLFNYANLLSKLKNEPTETSILSKVNKLIAGVFIIGLFISYWFDDQFS